MAYPNPSCPKGEETQGHTQVASIAKDQRRLKGATVEPQSLADQGRYSRNPDIANQSGDREPPQCVALDLSLHQRGEDQARNRQCHRQSRNKLQTVFKSQANPGKSDPRKQEDWRNDL